MRKTSRWKSWRIVSSIAAILVGLAIVFALAPNRFWHTVWWANPSAPNAAYESTSVIEHIQAGEFDAKVLQAKVPVLVDFYADWCGPCQALAPVLERVAKEAAGAKIVKVNVDKNPALAEKYQIRAIPSLLVFRDGKLTRRHTGLADEAALKQLLQ
jgi:thioredoxin 1